VRLVSIGRDADCVADPIRVGDERAPGGVPDPDFHVCFGHFERLVAGLVASSDVPGDAIDFLVGDAQFRRGSNRGSVGSDLQLGSHQDDLADIQRERHHRKDHHEHRDEEDQRHRATPRAFFLSSLCHRLPHRLLVEQFAPRHRLDNGVISPLSGSS